MKKLLVLAVLVLFTAGWVSADSPIYVKSFPIYKIVAHEKGYKVTYATAHGDAHVIYVPIEWFYQTSDFRTDDGFVKAELVMGPDPAFPYVQFFWKNGVFHHLRLFARSNLTDLTWGTVDPAENLASKFDPSKALDLKF